MVFYSQQIKRNILFMLPFYVLIVLASYLLGAFPFMILEGRIKGVDLSREADLHHALWFKVGRGWGIAGVLFDIIKGIIPVLVGFLLGLPLAVTALAGLASLCGQMWPAFRHFDGERGNTTGLGIMGTFSIANGAPLIVIIAVSCAAIGILIRTINRWKKSGDSLNERLKFSGPPSLALPLGVIVGYISCPFTSWLLSQPWEITACYTGIAILILIRRLTAGLIADLKPAKNRSSIIINRLLFDRNEI